MRIRFYRDRHHHGASPCSRSDSREFIPWGRRGLFVDRPRFCRCRYIGHQLCAGCYYSEIGHADVILGGRQAIDGDTAQVGPQVAQKLGLPQVTYVEEILKCATGR
mgnify:CR=1 FL=1